ncbi:heavy metal-responsive transcriptional regulator [Ideonella sp. DXS29W]|uniref:Heavy metal-responsive transcriptional regulator n=1 Tax=Ideonella lacteola TaxID=2984193 RepID=A0ABU9BHS4_9BURK
MNIGALARLTGVSADTLRYYEREQLLAPAGRAPNGYRVYSEVDAQRVRFVRSAQALGFSLAEIRNILPRLDGGQVQRADIELHLNRKLDEIDGHIAQLKALRREVVGTLAALTCEPQRPVSVAGATDRQRATGPRASTSLSTSARAARRGRATG